MLGSTYGFPGTGWCIISVFFVLTVRPKLSHAIAHLSTLFRMLALVVAFSTQSWASRNSLMIFVFALVFAWTFLRLKTEPSVRYQVSITLSKPLHAANSITENMILKSMGARTHPCFTTFVTGKATELSLLSCTLAWNCFTMVINFQSRRILPWFSKAVSADYVKCLGQIKISSVEVSVLLRIDSTVRVHVRDVCCGDSEGIWLGSCPKLKVRRCRGDYRMPVGSLSAYKWSPAVVILSPKWTE